MGGRSSELIHLHFFIIIAIALFPARPFAASLSFNYSGFSVTNAEDIFYERSSPIDNVIQLIPPNQRDIASIGRATRRQPLQLWDKATRKLADFTTDFSFVIDSNGSSPYGDGLAFFLAPPEGSRIPAVTTGGSLGLTRDNQELNVTYNSFVAVEFDIYRNPWDPEFDHVGIDINSMESVTNVSWYSSILDGRESRARISYDSSSQNLSVVFTGYYDGEYFDQGLYYIVNLSNYLPDNVTFGFSAASGNATASISIKSWSFSSSLEIDEKTTNTAEAPGPGPGPAAVVITTSPNSDSNRTTVAPATSGSNMGRLVGLAAGGSGFVLVIIALGFVYFAFARKRNKRGESKENHPLVPEDPMDGEFEKGIGPKKFSYTELAMATNNFAQQQKLGEGGFGEVYRGFLRELNSYVAVKKVSSESEQGIKEYASEVKIVSRLRHKNLVQLIGWCHEKIDELLLVYELMSNGSLDSHLFKGKSLLAWGVRYKIAKGLASALLYLHEEWEQCVLHRDIKSSNVMLDSNFNAKLGDFGLARFVDHEKGSQTTILAGTMGYMAPECSVTYQFNRESDVYSFGVVALEIACGRKPINLKAQKNQIRMVEWVWDLYEMGKLLEAADPKLSANFDKQEMEQLMIVGLWCAHPDSKLRPSIRQAIHVLNSEAPLPILPPKIPVAIYYTPSTNTYSSSQSLAYGSTSVSESNQAQSSSYNDNTDSSKIVASS